MLKEIAECAGLSLAQVKELQASGRNHYETQCISVG